MNLTDLVSTHISMLTRLIGMANSRMKDYFDLRALAHEGVLDARQLGDALAATFQRRKTLLPEEMPLGLSDEFAHDATKQAQWNAFLGKNRLDAPTLHEVVAEVRSFATEPFKLARQRKAWPGGIDGRSTALQI